MRARDPRQFRCTRLHEALAWRRGWRRVAGCDEAGRGALLGPLYAAAVILDPDQPIAGLDDSKKLAPEVRAELDVEIRAHAIAFQVVAVPAAEVDALNVYQASRRAMIQALGALAPPPDFVLTDAMRLSGWGDAVEYDVPYRALIHGDARSVSIAAASILAKVARDAHLVRLDRLYPQYQLARNKGYGTPEHLDGLAHYGPCPEHRQTFQPVKIHLLPLFPLRPLRPLRLLTPASESQS
ncbi:MAG TPA: ribonuclease HII [Terriglobia bacterium]|nr:ribonuclease HII [Terriglobia bacterium]